MKSFTLLILGAVALLSGCATARTNQHIPNLAQVTTTVWRGGQPDAEGLCWLRTNGFRYIVKLNEESEGAGWKDEDYCLSPTSEGIARDRVTYWCGGSACFEVSYLPIDLRQQILGRVPPQKVENALRQMRYLPATGKSVGMGPGKVYVHCEHGQDRTGLIVACYRVRVQGWTKAAAEKEMLAHGFHKSLLGLWEFWEDFSTNSVTKH